MPFVDDADDEDVDQALIPAANGGEAGRRRGRARTKASETRARKAGTKDGDGSANGVNNRVKSTKCAFALCPWAASRQRDICMTRKHSPGVMAAPPESTPMKQSSRPAEGEVWTSSKSAEHFACHTVVIHF